MPKQSNADIHVEFVTQNQVEFNQNNKDSFSLSSSAMTIVDKTEFVRCFQAKHGSLLDRLNIKRFWDSLFGHHPTDKHNNPHYHFLTSESCEQVLAHYHLFKNGIDFEHLPAGFFITKNPANEKLNVLDFSEAYKKYQHISPLAITLSKKGAFQPHNDFQGEQKVWYDFFLSKAHGYCSEAELRQAFISFSNTIKRLNLEFYPSDFSLLTAECNPIILLGRFTTVMENMQLREEDRQIQWEALLQLPLIESHLAIRALTDFQYSNQPCTFLIPEMNFDMRSYITPLNNHWNKLAYEKKRLSIKFYKRVWYLLETAIEEPLTDEEARGKEEIFPSVFAQYIIATTGIHHLNFSSQYEEAQTLLMEKIFSSYREETGSMIHTVMDKAHGRGYYFEAALDLSGANLKFLSQYCHELVYLLSINPILFASVMVKNVPHLLKQDDLVKTHGNDYDLGAKFYFKNNNETLIKYIKLVTHLNQIIKTNHFDQLFRDILPLLSSFSLLSNNEIDKAVALLAKVRNRERIDQVLILFKELLEQQPAKEFVSLINFVDNLPETITNEELLTQLEQRYSAIFPNKFFAEEKKKLKKGTQIDHEALKTALAAYRFHANDYSNLFSLEKRLFRKNPNLSLDVLNLINDDFLALKGLLLPSDFTKLVKQLETLPSIDVYELHELLKYLVDIRSITAFNQIVICSKREGCDHHIASKIKFYLETIRPLSASLKTTISDKALMHEALAALVLNTPWSTPEFQEVCSDAAKLMLQTSEGLLDVHPSVKQRFFEGLAHLTNKNKESYLTHVNDYMTKVSKMSALLGENSPDKLVCFSLFAHFNTTPLELVSIIKSMETRNLPDEKQQFVLKLISQLKDNQQSLEGINELIHVLEEDSNFNLLKKYCPTPPYPSILTMTQWLKEGNLAKHYERFSLTPFGKRHLDYGFKLRDFQRQAPLFKFMDGDINPFKEPNLAKNMDSLIKANRHKTVLQLQEEFTQQKQIHEENSLPLLLLCVEMLSRTTTQFQAGTTNLISQELNTTQIMALWTIIKNPHSKLISEIETGEGKSRIMMVLAAFYAAQEKTVDIITSDLALSERDFLSYRSFFNALGIPTSFIDINTPPSLYQKEGGVNFSDNSQLLLLRNKSDISLTPFDYLDKNEENRVLLGDEIDEFIHDKSKDSYNFATKSKTLSHFVWVYPSLVNFVEVASKKGYLTFDKTLVSEFIKYINTTDNDATHIERLARLEETNNELLITWLHSAHTALNMLANTDYKVTPPEDNDRVAMLGPDGNIHYSRQVLVVKNGRPVIGSTFAHGVQQCLCAIENKKAGAEEFVIQAENEIQRASFPLTFIEKYKKGRVIGVSGTTRSAAPKAHKEINYQDYHYLQVPRHHPLQRMDDCAWHANDDAQHINFLIYELLKNLRANPAQPTLIVCKDDNQSAALYTALQSNDEIQAWMKKHVCPIQRIEGLSPKQEELDAIARAGTKATITLSTVGMFGRGVDIHADNLSVIAAYIPSLEDEKQIQGRTGRAGKKGDYRLIFNMKDSDINFKKKHDIRHAILGSQYKNAFSAVFQEEVANLYAHFLEDVTLAFLDNLNQCPMDKKEATLLAWQGFLNGMQKNWVKQKQPLMAAFDSGKEDAFKETFELFTTNWLNQLKQQFNIEITDKAQIDTVYRSLQASHHFFMPPKKLQTLRKARYDRADDGQARIYDSVFEPIYATFRGERPLFADFRAWREGRGELFPDLMATIHGERKLFVHLREWISELLDSIHRYFCKSPSSSEKPEENHFEEGDMSDNLTANENLSFKGNNY